ncbi:hypothetical protein H0H87_012200 [Tephrocybe sp. NHM501043]|nr:hypothetical protein H0H87_012200 [Tephrocybe sp. NHM501043]
MGTINHRKLVQELYDKRILHNLLGVKPQLPITSANGTAPKSNGPKPPSSHSQTAAASSIKSAWQEADREPDSPRKRRHDLDDDEEQGRYTIGRQQPPSKRQKTGSRKDAHVTFMTDEDESQSEDEKEDLQYGSEIEIIERPTSTRSTSSKDIEKADNRRSYWLSKGVGIEGSSA